MMWALEIQWRDCIERRGGLTKEEALTEKRRILFGRDRSECEALLLIQDGVPFPRKGLAFFDVDSTLIYEEVIDELARAAGCVDAVASLTKKAMEGGMDFREALRSRLGLLRGLSAAVLPDLAKALTIREGAFDLINELKNHGFEVYAISGGFDFAVAPLAENLGLHGYFAQTLEVLDGRLTGHLKDPSAVIDGQRKAEIVRQIQKEKGLTPAETVVVGDGANDTLMMQEADLSIAIGHKEKVWNEANGVWLRKDFLGLFPWLLRALPRHPA